MSDEVVAAGKSDLSELIQFGDVLPKDIRGFTEVRNVVLLTDLPGDENRRLKELKKGSTFKGARIETRGADIVSIAFQMSERIWTGYYRIRDCVEETITHHPTSLEKTIDTIEEAE